MNKITQQLDLLCPTKEFCPHRAQSEITLTMAKLRKICLYQKMHLKESMLPLIYIYIV